MTVDREKIVQEIIGNLGKDEPEKFLQWENGSWRTYYAGFNLTQFALDVITLLPAPADREKDQAPSLAQTPLMRDKIAAIIDPDAKFKDILDVRWSRFEIQRRDLAYSKTDTILAILTAPVPAVQPELREGISALIKIAAECHRTKWQFDLSEDFQPSKASARALILQAFHELHRIGDLAIKAKDALAAHPSSSEGTADSPTVWTAFNRLFPEYKRAGFTGQQVEDYNTLRDVIASVLSRPPQAPLEKTEGDQS